MKTNKAFAYGIFAVIILLLCTVCLPDTPSKNQPPTANAGTDQTHTLASDLTITLNGTGSAGNITAYLWQCETYTANQGAVSAEYTSAQVNALIANAAAPTATVAPRKAGTYVFKLTITGDEGESDTDTVVVEAAGTVQKDVTVSYPNATIGSTTINLTPDFSPEDGWGEYFNASDITCTMTDTLGNTWNNGTGFTVNANSYSNSTTYAFTQTFKMNDVNKGSYVIRIRVTLANFASFRDSTDNALSPSNVLPPMPTPLHLERPITELPQW
jgi:hypothetical protein